MAAADGGIGHISMASPAHFNGKSNLVPVMDLENFKRAHHSHSFFLSKQGRE
jgi:hypothetical protein